MAIEFYYNPQSPASQTVWMILKELDIEHKGVVIDLMSGKNRAEDFLAINAFGKVPAIRDGDFTLSESRAIAIYLCRKYEPEDKKKKLYPTGLKEQAEVDRAMFVGVDNQACIDEYMNGEAVYYGRAGGPKEESLPKVKKALTNMETLLGDRDYLVGHHLTIVDLMALADVVLLAMAGFSCFDEFPKVKKWLDTMSALPYYDECHGQQKEKNTQFFQSLMQKFNEQSQQE